MNIGKSVDTSTASPATYCWLIVIILFAMLPYFLGLGMADVRDMDESAYGEIAREMIESGDFLDPTWNYVPFYEHPPLMLWLIALSVKLIGVNAYAVRLPGALLGVAGVILTYLLGKLLFDRKTGVAAAMALPTVPFYHLMVADARLDIGLLVFITLTFYCLVSFLIKRKISYLLVAYVACGLSFLTKGPIGIIVPCLVVGAYIIITRKWKLILELRPITGLLIVMAVVLPWYLFMYERHGWEFIQNLVIRQNFERYFGGSEFVLEDPSFYLHTFLWMFLPWVVPLGWMLAKKALRTGLVARFTHTTAGAGYRPGAVSLLVVLWFVLPILLMSLAKTKQDRYIFFVFPAAALIAGQFIKQYLDATLSAAEARGYGIFNVVFASVFGAALLWMMHFFFPFDGLAFYLLTAGLVLFICLISFFSYRSDFRVGTIIPIVLLLTLYHFLYTTHISPMIMKYQPFRGFAQDMRTLNVPEGPIFLYETDQPIKQADKPSINFYSGRRVIVTWGDYPAINKEETADGKGVYMIVAENLIPHLEEIGYAVRVLSVRPHYDIITPTRKEFIFARTRHEVIDRYVLAYITRVEKETER